MQFIDEFEEKYITSLLNQRDPHQKEVGLERLCSWYRKKCFLRDAASMAELLIVNFSDTSPKIRRWALNAMAQVGSFPRREVYAEAVAVAISQNLDDPEIVCAGYAALFAVCPEGKALRILSEKKLPLEGAFLVSAAQHSDAMRERLITEKVHIEKATILELKNAAILIGLNKAPENMFHPKFLNKDVIGRLNLHGDSKVVQYSVWAVTENSNLSIEDLTLDIKNIESFPENVRGWLYKLMVQNPVHAKKYLDYIHELGANDNSIEAREGLATGLQGIYFAGLEESTMRWAAGEGNHEIKSLLFDHMASTANQCAQYKEEVLKRYRSARLGSVERLRLKACGIKGELFAEMQKIDFEDERGGLFGSSSLGLFNTINLEVKVVNQNVSGNNINIGNMVGTGNVENSPVSIIQNIQNPELKEILTAALDLLNKANLTSEEKVQAEKLITEVAKDPSKPMLKKLEEWALGLSTLVHGAALIEKLTTFINTNF